MEVQTTRKQYRLGALNTLTKQKNVLKPSIDKIRNYLVANPIEVKEGKRREAIEENFKNIGVNVKIK